MATPLVGTTMPLPLPVAGILRFDVILLHPNGTKGVETVLIDYATLPTEIERFNQAQVLVAAAIRTLYTWQKAL